MEVKWRDFEREGGGRGIYEAGRFHFAFIAFPTFIYAFPLSKNIYNNNNNITPFIS